jgi:F-type H+-transporting ATPase subunit g
MSALTTLRTRAASLASRAAAAADPAVKAASAEYEKLIAANAAYVVKDPAAADKLFKQLVFTKLAR